jgi:hypothetical protein
MERIASHTKQPEVLGELFAALGNDPFLIAECLARPVVAERLVTDLYARDQRFHGALKRRAESELQTHQSARQMQQTSGTYTEMEWIKSDAAEADSAPADAKRPQAFRMNSSKWQEAIARLAVQFHGIPQSEATALGVRRYSTGFGAVDISAHSKGGTAYGGIPIGKLSPLPEDDSRYYTMAVIEKGKHRLKTG